MRSFGTAGKNEKLNYIAVFASGGLLGAGLALLLAPQSGTATRRSLTRLGTSVQKRSRRLRKDLNRKMDHLLADIEDDLKSSINDGKTWTEEKKSEIEHALKTGKQQIEKEMEKILYS